MDLYTEGDWTTYEGLAAEQDYEPVVFGTKKSMPKPSPAKPKADKRTNFGGVAVKGIDKKKKKVARGAGLMSRPAAPAEEAEEEEPTVPSPFIKNTKNPYAALGAMMEAEEAEAEAEANALAKAAASKNVVEHVADAVANAMSKASKTPVARRTRTAFKSITQTMSDVVAAVSNSPMITGKWNQPAKENAAPAPRATKAAAAKAAAAKATVTKEPVAAPVRRSTRLK